MLQELAQDPWHKLPELDSMPFMVLTHGNPDTQTTVAAELEANHERVAKLHTYNTYVASLPHPELPKNCSKLQVTSEWMLENTPCLQLAEKGATFDSSNLYISEPGPLSPCLRYYVRTTALRLPGRYKTGWYRTCSSTSILQLVARVLVRGSGAAIAIATWRYPHSTG